jgi:diaminohydroxyphosphoribosylaminopyrimidine deaminase/5-amino-6-(5-phosphoribosylamino)uracil reductase
LNYVKEGREENNVFLKLNEDKPFVEQSLERLYEQKICSIVVEGGEKTLNKFLEANLWDEANVIVGEKNFGKGVKAPNISQGLVSMENIGGDILKIYHNQKKL